MTGIYIHIPFCAQKCPYCSFNSYDNKSELIPKYIDRIIKEIKTYERQKANSVYFGGGTPTLLGSEDLSRLLFAVSEHFYLEKESEITIEANPGTVDAKKLSALYTAGFNRVSVGIQSFVEGELLALGRIHTPRRGYNTVLDAYNVGIKNISADLMFGIPNQTMDSLNTTIDTMLGLPITHISAYSLSIDEGTPFYEQKLNLPDEDTERTMYGEIISKLAEAGFEHYEISNFAKKGKRGIHNTKYWTSEEYIGIGAGAHSYYSNERYFNVLSPKEYIKNFDVVQDRVLIDESEKEKEYYMLGLRLCEGVYDRGHPAVKKLLNVGLLERADGRVRLTTRGLDLANIVFAEFV